MCAVGMQFGLDVRDVREGLDVSDVRGWHTPAENPPSTSAQKAPSPRGFVSAEQKHNRLTVRRVFSMAVSALRLRLRFISLEEWRRLSARHPAVAARSRSHPPVNRLLKTLGGLQTRDVQCGAALLYKLESAGRPRGI
jgi:hypothetical protein